MPTVHTPLETMTAADIMKSPVFVILRGTPLRQVAHQMRQEQISAAPVVDDEGRCVGMLSAVDFLRWAEEGGAEPEPASLEIRSCRYQIPGIREDGKEASLCGLPEATCPMQAPGVDLDGINHLFCQLDHCVFVDWQEVDEQPVPDLSTRYMTRDLVIVDPDTPVPLLARAMVNAHIHHLIVIDAGNHPVGMISSTDLMAVLAHEADRMDLPP